MSVGPPPHIKDPSLFPQNIPSFINLAPPPPPPPLPVAIEPEFNAPPMNHPLPAPMLQQQPNIQQPPPQFEG